MTSLRHLKMTLPTFEEDRSEPISLATPEQLARQHQLRDEALPRVAKPGAAVEDEAFDEQRVHEDCERCDDDQFAHPARHAQRPRVLRAQLPRLGAHVAALA